MRDGKVIVSEELLKQLSEGRVKYAGRRIRVSRWVIKEKRGVLIGCKGEVKD